MRVCTRVDARAWAHGLSCHCAFGNLADLLLPFLQMLCYLFGLPLVMHVTALVLLYVTCGEIKHLSFPSISGVAYLVLIRTLGATIINLLGLLFYSVCSRSAL